MFPSFFFLCQLIPSIDRTGVAHVMTPIAVTRSLPLVTNMAVVGQQQKHVAHILTNSSLDKVICCISHDTSRIVRHLTFLFSLQFGKKTMADGYIEIWIDSDYRWPVFDSSNEQAAHEACYGRCRPSVDFSNDPGRCVTGRIGLDFISTIHSSNKVPSYVGNKYYHYYYYYQYYYYYYYCLLPFFCQLFVVSISYLSFNCFSLISSFFCVFFLFVRPETGRREEHTYSSTRPIDFL